MAVNLTEITPRCSNYIEEVKGIITMIAADLLTKDEIQRFSERSDLAALRIVLGNWVMIAGIFAMVAVWTNPLTIALALVLLAGRQLSLAVIVHDCGHNSMFTRLKWNRFAAYFLAAPFIFSEAKSYRVKHRKHHQLGGTHEDPDLQNYVNYAVTRQSFFRKMRRDLTGVTGWKTLKFSAKAFGPGIVAMWIAGNALLFGTLYAFGEGWLYLLWIATFFTTYMVVIRIRQAAEHAVVPDQFDPDPRKHTRTTYARWWERLVFAPNYVNYHLEHHILPSVPCYRLREFHDYLVEQGHMDDAVLCDGYWNVIKQLVLPVGAEDDEASVAT